MTAASRPELVYRTSSRCSKGGCVEVAPLPEGGAIMRDTKDRSREAHVYDAFEWAEFVAGVKAREFDV